jgi:SIR2-like domain
VNIDPFNSDCIKTLEALHFQDRIVIIGSGLSYHLIKNTYDLVDNMAKPCKVQKVDSEPPCDFFDRAFSSDPEAYYTVLRNAFDERPPFDARAYQHLVRIPFKSFVTLNIDGQLPSAYLDTRRHPSEHFFKVYPGNTIYLPPELSGSDQRLVAVHGYKHPHDKDWCRNLILRYTDYVNHYWIRPGSPPPFLFLWWYWLLTTVDCVFIGTSLEEYGLAYVIRTIIDTGKAELIENRHIHLKAKEKAAGPDMSLKVIKQVLYDELDADHKGLRLVLSKFSKLPEDFAIPSEDKEPFPFRDSLAFLKKASGGLSAK